MCVPLLCNCLYLYLFVFLQQSSGHSWLGSQSSSSGLVVKKTIKVDIPVDKYPTVSFIMFYISHGYYIIITYPVNQCGMYLFPETDFLLFA